MKRDNNIIYLVRHPMLQIGLPKSVVLEKLRMYKIELELLEVKIKRKISEY